MGKKKPTLKEQKHMEKVASIGCIACRKLGIYDSPAEIHHIKNFTGAGNDNLKTFSETSFSVTVAAGDILITAIKGTTNAKTAYFVSTVEIEWTS